MFNIVIEKFARTAKIKLKRLTSGRLRLLKLAYVHGIYFIRSLPTVVGDISNNVEIKTIKSTRESQ